MTERQRVLNALRREPVDIPAVQYLYTDVGVYEHGDRLNALFEKYPGDFGPFRAVMPPNPPQSAFGSDGRYYETKRDDWGTLWEYRIFGRMGHAIDFPIKCVDDYKRYAFPPLPAYCTDPAVFAARKDEIAREKQQYAAFRGEGYSYLERLFALRGFENTMIDLMDGGPEINGFLDRLTDHYLVSIQKLLAMGVDCISFGDDYGTQQSLLLSVELFRETIAPRLKRLMDPIREADAFIYFHSCGKVLDLFPVFEELGVNAIWPQLPAYTMEELAAACRKHRFSLAIHTDRAHVMTHGTPDMVRELVRKEAAVFRPQDGGGWFFIEVDNGFPYENIVALVEEVYSLRT